MKRFEKIAEIGKIVAKLILDGGDKKRYDDFLDAAITQSVLAIYASEAEKTIRRMMIRRKRSMLPRFQKKRAARRRLR